MKNFSSYSSILLVALLAGCATAPVTAPMAVNASCVGSVISPPVGWLREVDDPALLQSAIGASGAGKLCAGKVFVAIKPVTVYRVWDKSKSWSELGSWWSLS